jgi:tetratricopeptide (TPR) repeat protein
MRRFLVCAVLLLSIPLPALADDAALEALIERGHWREVRAAVEPRAGAGSTDAAAIYMFSRVKLVLGETKEALALAERAVALDGRKAQYHFQLAECLGSMAQDAGPLKGLGLARRFKKEVDLTIALDPKHVEARNDLLEFYWQAPGLVGGDKKKARAQADTMAQIDPASGALAQIRLAQRDKKPAAELDAMYQKALAQNPKSYDVLMSVASWSGRDTRKQWDLTEKVGKAAIELDPGRSGGYSVLASVYAHLDRWSDLDQLLAQSEQALPHNLAAYYQAGRVLLVDNKELPRAERYFRKYMTQEPEIGSPALAHAHWRLGLVYEKLGRAPDAVSELEAALKLKPDLDEAKKDLKRVKKG